jgi:hypothetical protein
VARGAVQTKNNCRAALGLAMADWAGAQKRKAFLPFLLFVVPSPYLHSASSPPNAARACFFFLFVFFPHSFFFLPFYRALSLLSLFVAVFFFSAGTNHQR